MKHSILSIICVVGIALIISRNTACCLADSAASTDVTNILRSLFTDKTLVLSSKPKFIIQTSQDDDSSLTKYFVHVDVIAPRMIQQFEFKSQLSRPNHPTTVMRVAANEDHTTVLIETSEGQPYCLMTDHFFVICDPDNLGGLAYYDGGTVLWGLFQSLDKTNTSFQMTFMATNIPPVAILNLSFVIESAFAKMTNASYEASNRTIKIETIRGFEEIELSDANPYDSLGIKEVKLHGDSATFDFSDFQIETASTNGLFQFSKRDLQKLNLPLRALNASDLGQMKLFIPEGFPNTIAEKELGNKLMKLITSR